jgi:hypothetical protein
MIDPDLNDGRERAVRRLYGKGRLDSGSWITGVVVGAVILIGAVVLASGRGHQSQTSTTDGKNVEQPATTGSGSTR